MTAQAKTPKFLSKAEGSPCHNCIITMICTKSFVLRTACDDYRHFISSLIKINLPPPEEYKYGYQDED